MAYTDINSEDRLVQKTFVDHLRDALGWESVYAFNDEMFGPEGTLGRTDTREVVLMRDLRAAIARLNPQLPATAVEEAAAKMARHDFSRSLLQHNHEFHGFIRDGVPVSYTDTTGQRRETRARVIDFQNGNGADGKPNNRFVAVSELKITGLRSPSYNRPADIVCFVNGLPLVFIELKAVYKNIRAGFDGNLRDYLDEHVIAHAFDPNAFLVVSNGHRARMRATAGAWMLYIDKSMKAHTLMQAIARANRVYPGKDFGLIADYNGMLRSLREALAQYALGDEGGGAEEIVAPIEERVKALLAAIEETEAHLLKIGFDTTRMIGAKGFTRIAAIADDVEAVINARDDGRRRFEVVARQVFVRFKALVMEPAAFTYAERHDNIEAITADVTEVLKALHRSVNEAIRAQDDHSRSVEEDSPSRFYDLSRIDFAKLRDEFAKKVKRKATAIEDIRKIVEERLAQMLARTGGQFGSGEVAA
ncbi:MAG: type I restriction endonuclease [Chthoniobacteraceae bacterium]